MTTRSRLVSAGRRARQRIRHPRVIYVSGVIDPSVDDNNPLACKDYYRNGFTLEAFLATFDPTVRGSSRRPGCSAKRAKPRAMRSAHVILPVGSHGRLWLIVLVW